MTRRLVMLPPPDELTDAWAQAVAKAAPGLEVVVAPDRATALKWLPQAEAAYGTLDPELLACAQQLQWLQAPQAAPPAGYFFAELVAHPVAVTNFRGIYNDHVAIHAVALLLALARNLHTYMRQQPAGDWSRHLADSDILHLPESTVLVVGVGGIGAEIARQLHAFGARVVGVDPRRSDCPEGMASLHPPALGRKRREFRRPADWQPAKLRTGCLRDERLLYFRSHSATGAHRISRFAFMVRGR